MVYEASALSKPQHSQWPFSTKWLLAILVLTYDNKINKSFPNFHTKSMVFYQYIWSVNIHFTWCPLPHTIGGHLEFPQKSQMIGGHLGSWWQCHNAGLKFPSILTEFKTNQACTNSQSRQWLTITTPHFLNKFWQNYCQLHWTLYNDQHTTHFKVQSQVIHIHIKICLPKHISLFQNPCPTKQQIINGWSTQVSIKWVLYLTQKKLTHWGSHLCFTWRHGCYRRHLEIAKGPVQKSEKSCQYQ